MIFELDNAACTSALMRVIGVGGAGGNAVNRMIDEDLEGVEFISANTDAQALAQSNAPKRIQLGKRLTRGLGAGARPGVGRQAIAEDAEEVRDILEGSDLVFIAAGMGGGTGTGAAPVIGEMARELGALAIAVVTRPFSFEGKKRMRQAEQGLAELRRAVDTMIIVPNDRLLTVAGKGMSFRDALKKADEVLLHATQGISDLIRVSGDVNVDFADVRTIMSSCGAALMGTGTGRGEARAVKAASDAVASPLLDNVSILGAKGVLINITGGSDLAIGEVTEISTMIQEEAGDEAEIIFGAVQDSTMDGEVRVTLIATGFDDQPGEAVEEAGVRSRLGHATGGTEARPALGRVSAANGAPRRVGSSPGIGREAGSRQPAMAAHGARPATGRTAPLASRGGNGQLFRDGARPERRTGGLAPANGGARPSNASRSATPTAPILDVELPTFIKRINA